LRDAQITICEEFDGTVTLLYKGKKMKYKTYKRSGKQLTPQNAKTLNERIGQNNY